MKKKNTVVPLIQFIIGVVLLGSLGVYGHRMYTRHVREKEILKQMLVRFQADSRIAEVIVTDVSLNPVTGQQMTTIKFLEYGSDGTALEPKYFTFAGNIIQFQSLVVRFEDKFIASGDQFRGKSLYLFWKAFVLDGPRTQEYVITPVNEVPQGYKIDGGPNDFEGAIWQEFWDYALLSDKAIKKGIKNAQIEAPGMKFVPGVLYTLKIEHDGGIRIDVTAIPQVLKGEKIL